MTIIPKPKSALPSTNQFRDLHTSSFLSGSAKTEFNKRLTNSYKPLLEVGGNDVPDYATSLIEACANGKQTTASLLVMAAALVPNGLGTKTTKFPNTNIVVEENALMAHPLIRSSVGVTSSNTSLFRPYMCAGNAADIAAQRLLSASIILNGQRHTIVDDFITHGPIYQFLYGMNAASVSVIHTALQNRLSNPSVLKTAHTQNKNHANHGGIATIWQPINRNATEFHILSAVASIPMIAEVRTREIDGKLKLGDRLTTKVGGAQPQNAGLFAMDQAGFIRHLSSFPPRFQQRKSVYLTPYFLRLKKLFNDEGEAIRNNINVKNSHRAIVDTIIDRIVGDMIDPPFGNPIDVTVENIMDAVKRNAKKAETIVYVPEIFQEIAEQYATEEGNV